MIHKQLVEYHAIHGHCFVKMSENNALAQWCSRQRAQKRNTVTEDQLERLNAIGFGWEKGAKLHFKQMWEERFIELTKFRLEFGHTRVKFSEPGRRTLATWVSKQRKTNKKGRLPADKVERLDQIGFLWKVNNMREDRDTSHLEEQFHEVYNKLVAYKNEHGDCMVPRSNESDLSLARWINKRRIAYKKGDMPEYQKQLLDEIGFVWKADINKPETSLIQRHWGRGLLRQACEIQREMQSLPCCVYSSEGERSLDTWLATQRDAQRSGFLPASRFKRLDDLGFLWTVDDSDEH